ncbi:MAG: hypothetical protein K0S18_2196 [Anaerocolumna sp.]|nr:hypothetical protein [Anaerocolumna sp.]
MRVYILMALLFIGAIPVIFVSFDMIKTYTQNAIINRKNEIQRQGNTVVNLITQRCRCH